MPDTLEIVTEPIDRMEVAVPEDIAALFTPKPAAKEEVSAPGADKVADAAAEVKSTKKMSPARAAAVDRAKKIEDARIKVNERVLRTETVIPRLQLPVSKRLETVLPKFEEVATAGDLKAAASILLTEADARAQEFAQVAAQTAVAADRDARITRQESRAKSKWPDWDAKLREAGVFDGCRKLGINQDGSVRYQNQEMGEAVYSEDNPAEAAYDLADTILKVRRGEPLEDEIVEQIEKKPAAPAAVVVPAAEPARVVQNKDELSAAVAQAGSRPKGIGQLSNAGSPTVSYSREDLDKLMETNPTAYLKLVEGNKELSDWHMGRS